MIGIYSMIDDKLIVKIIDRTLEEMETWINGLGGNLDIYAKEMTQ